MNLLLIESSTSHPQAGWGTGDDWRTVTADRGGLAPKLAELQIDFHRLDAYGFSVGPGSFTGLRVGLSLLKGLAFVYPAPVVAVSSLRLWAASAFAAHPDVNRVGVCLDARRSRVFAAVFDRVEPETAASEMPEAAYPMAEARLRFLEEAEGWVGDPVQTLDLSPRYLELPRPDVRTFRDLCVQAVARGEGLEAALVEPRYYLRTEVEEALDAAQNAGQPSDSPQSTR
ncbi:MAG: tRNA (adenosine(37)-N6)-threonylcarbamoyltransferase complex dimerization subunit type 1 TsaB [Myxococcota bacterium]